MKYPKHVKCWSAKNNDGKRCTEWVVRLYDEQMEDKDGNKIKTPKNLLNRYYTLMTPNPDFKSHLWEKKSVWLTFEDLNHQK